MRPVLVAVSALLLVGIPFSNVRAQTRFAFVDARRALEEVEEGKNAKNKLKKQFDEKQKQLDEKQEEIKRDMASLESLSKEGVLKDEKLRDKKADLEKKAMEVGRYYQESQKALMEDERRFTDEILNKMAVVIRGIAEAEGFQFVLDKNAGLLYAPDSLDITNEVVRKYNKQFGAGGKSGAAEKDGGKGAKAPAKK